MRWVRANLRFGSWSALFALAIQFTLLFGHFHRSETAGQAGDPSLLSVAAQGSSVTSDAPAGPSKPLGVAFDNCAICAVVNLLGTMLPPAAPAAETPSAFGRLQLLAGIDDNDVVAAPHLLFRARAPPLA